MPITLVTFLDLNRAVGGKLSLINLERCGRGMGRTKLGNANAQRNNNKKKKNGFNTEFASYAQNEAQKLSSQKKD